MLEWYCPWVSDGVIGGFDGREGTERSQDGGGNSISSRCLVYGNFHNILYVNLGVDGTWEQ